MFLCYRYVLISVHLHFCPTNVVLGGDFSVFVGLTESEKLSLEGTFSTDCHVNVSLLPVQTTSVHLHFFLINVVLGGDFSVFTGLTESEKLSLEGTFYHVNVSDTSVESADPPTSCGTIDNTLYIDTDET